MGSGEAYIFLLYSKFSQVFFHHKANTRMATLWIIIPSLPHSRDWLSDFNGSKKTVHQQETCASWVLCVCGFLVFFFFKLAAVVSVENGKCIKDGLT